LQHARRQRGPSLCEQPVGDLAPNIRFYAAEYSVEFQARHRDGSYRWILSRGVVVRRADGQPVRFVGTRIDIAECKAIEDALRERRTFPRHL
jgi:PAS domain-containing protein